MKYYFLFLVILILGGVFAMEDPIKIQTDPNNSVKIYIWPPEYGPAINVDKGITNDEGIFETTFYSLNLPSFRIQVSITDSEKEKIRDATFSDVNSNNPLLIDCTLSDCSLVVLEKPKEIEVTEGVTEEENETPLGATQNSELEGKEKNITITDVSEEIIIQDEVIKNPIEEIYFTGKATFDRYIFTNKKYSFLGGFFILVSILFFLMISKRKKKTSEILTEDDKELAYMEEQIKETEKKIFKIKEDKEKKIKIDTAKAKLEREKKELKELEKKENDSEEMTEKIEDA